MANKGTSAAPIFATGAVGVILVYGAISGKSPLTLFRALLHGQNPATVNPSADISGVGGSSSTGTSSAGITGATSGKTYTIAEMRALWIANGGSESSSVNAACHGQQESSGRAWITSPNPNGGTNVGIWQLDTTGVGSGHTVAELQDPNTNARITVQATNDGQNWSKWSSPGC